MLTVFFTESSGFSEEPDEYFASDPEEIPKAQERIYTDYNENEIKNITVSNEPEERIFCRWGDEE